jgi:hypothetical protein
MAAAAKLMRSEGLDLLLDLIVGLPGDTADDVARGAEELLVTSLDRDGRHAPGMRRPSAGPHEPSRLGPRRPW